MYLDINHYINFARCQAGDALVPAGYDSLVRAAELASQEGRAIFPLSGDHNSNLGGIKDPKHRRSIADVMELFSGFQYLLGRPEIAQLEIEAGIANLLGESNGRPIPLVGNTFGWHLVNLPPAPRLTKKERRAQNVDWVRTHAAPWVKRRLTGKSSSDSLDPRYPTLGRP